MRSVLLFVALLVLANCGIKRPLIAPQDIPAYEANQRKKQAQMKEDLARQKAAGIDVNDTSDEVP